MMGTVAALSLVVSAESNNVEISVGSLSVPRANETTCMFRNALMRINQVDW